MASYALRRVLGAVPTLLIIITLAFFMMRLAPGGPFDSQRHLPPEIERNVAAAYNLDKPVYEQYFIYLDGLAHGDLGPSYKIKDFTVGQLIAAGLPVSAKLGLSAIFLALFFGIGLGITAALHQNRMSDHGIMSVAMFGITIPNFVTAPLLTLLFGVYGLHFLGVDLSLPVAGWNGGALRNLILPVTVLALPQIAIISRLVRGSMVEVLHSNYVRTARAKGMPSHVIVTRHALRAALLPLVSYLGPAVAQLAYRFADRGADLRYSGHWPLFRPRRDRPRLHAGDGRRGRLCGLHHPVQPGGRSPLRRAGPARELPHMIATGVGTEASALMVKAKDIRGRSLWVDAWARLLRNRAAVVSIVILGLIALLAVFAPLLSQYGYSDTDYSAISCAPSWWTDPGVCNAGGTHWFGTDSLGRDLFVRILYGGRVSLAIGLVATLVSLLIGVAYGATAGYVGGRIDALMMRLVDVLYSLPFIFFVIILFVVFHRNFFLLFVAIGAVEWLTMARIVRSQALSIKEREYIEAARAAGVGTWGIIRRHVIPNLLGPVIVYVTLTIPAVILAESFLSFLGLGIQEPLTSWGVLIADGKEQMESYPWMLIFPCAFMAVTLFCFNFIGDGLRDALDPKDR